MSNGVTMNSIALPPMTHMALQLMVNPPKMTPISPVWACTVAQLMR